MMNIKLKKYLFSLLFIIFFLILFFLSNALEEKKVFDFTNIEQTKKELILQGQDKKAFFTENGLNIQSKNYFLALLSLKESGLTWEEKPYVKIEFEPLSKKRLINLNWYYNNYEDLNNYHQIIEKIPANKKTFILNTQKNIFFTRRFPWKKTYHNRTKIIRFGLILKGDITLKKITLSKNLSLYDTFSEFFKDFITINESRWTHTINFFFGTPILSKFISNFFGITFLICVVLTLLFIEAKKRKRFLILSFLICFFMVDIKMVQMLYTLAKKSHTISAFHHKEYDEYTSRFSEKFAKLNYVLRLKVPNGEKVLFPQPKYWIVDGESNWIRALYSEIYRTEMRLDRIDSKFYYDDYFEHPDYIFLFRPLTNNIIKKEDIAGESYYLYKHKNHTYIVKDLYKISDDVRIFKVLKKI